MRINRCLGCMAETETYPCPRCGYRGQQNPDYALPCGSILNGQYLLGRMLGQGGFGITYIGWDLTLDVKVAIKEYYPRNQVNRTRRTGLSLLWNNSEQAREWRQTGLRSVLQEAQKMARIDNLPQTVRVRHYFEENNTAYIVMDFVEGETLQHKLRREGPMSWNRAREIFIPVIEAMERVHAAGILHRDISPDNLMLAPDGRLRILDLGAAKDMTAAANASDALVEASSQLVVKNGFSPIEQYGARRGMGTWTDVYAMAATIYYTLTGKVPPVAGDRAAQDTLRFDGPELAGVPAHVRMALKHALAVKPGERTQTMGQLKENLSDTGVTPPPPLPPWKKIAIIAAACAAAVCAAVLPVRPKSEPQATASTVQTIAASTAATAAPTTLPPTTEAPTTEAPTTEATTAPETTEAPTEASMEATTAQNTTAAQSYRLIAAGAYHSVWVHEDGTVEAVGRSNKKRLDVDGWDEVIEVDAASHTVALRSDGTVYVTGPKGAGSQADVSDWSNIVHIAVGGNNTMGLCADGTVRIVGSNKKKQLEASQWTGITSIAMGEDTAYGVTQDGHVVAAGSDSSGQRSGVSDWSDIVAVSAGYKYVLGLCADGRVVAAGGNSYGQCDVGSWRNIVAISAGNNFAVGLCADGTVVMAGADNYDIEETIKSWTDIVAIDAGMNHVIALRSDGTLLAAGSNGYGQCDVTSR